MTFPFPNSAQSSIAPSSDNSSTLRSGRAQQSVWGAPPQAPAPRRGLAPLATSNLDSGPSSSFGLNSRRAGAASSPGPHNSATSPLATTFSSILTSSSRLYPGRHNSSNPSNPSSASPFTPLQAGSQQQPSQQSGVHRSSPRPRTVTPNSSYYLASSVATNTSQGGGGGSGGGGGAGTTRSAGFSPSLSGANIASPTSFSFDRSQIQSSVSGSGSGQSSLSKISTAQVLLLLDTISEKEGKAKWDSKAEQIRKVSWPNYLDPTLLCVAFC